LNEVVSSFGFASDCEIYNSQNSKNEHEGREKHHMIC